MKMNYDKELTLPSNSVAMEDTEMSYVDGGCKTQTYSWGRRVFFSARECGILAFAASRRGMGCFVGGVSSVISSCLSITGITSTSVVLGGSAVTIGSSLTISSSIFTAMSYQSGMYLDFNALTKSVSYGC